MTDTPSPTPSASPPSWILCATPRTGSTLLCSLLESTGVAGHPQSWFRRQDMGRMAHEWGVTPSPDAQVPFAAYLEAANRAGRTANRVFAARIMWGTMDELTANLAEVYPEYADDTAALLDRSFGPVRFIHLQREDIVAQAVSWMRAEQTQLWHYRRGEPVPLRATPRYHFGKLKDFVHTIDAHNAAWDAWFAKAGITPLRVIYETLDEDPAGTAADLLAALGITLPPGQSLESPTLRQADALNREWVARFHSDAAARTG
ncbi:Stf0 family sulfotransferase [Hyphomonas oceanitis]|uniref:Stf0 family sulfotransferase n=1 Tax=Hyphomonas oceanitis TaxID=81033 RepID=UPI003001A389